VRRVPHRRGPVGEVCALKQRRPPAASSPSGAAVHIEAIPRREGRDFVFVFGQRGLQDWTKPKARLDKAIQLKAKWTPHDLRRTIRTGLGALGVLPHVAEAVLNHLPAKFIGTYDRNAYTAEKRAALDLWANELDVAISEANGLPARRLSVRAVPANQLKPEVPRASFADRLEVSTNKRPRDVH